jgi:hypothetical protein
VVTGATEPATVPQVEAEVVPGAMAPRPAVYRDRPLLIILVCGTILRVLYHWLLLPCFFADAVTYVDAGWLLTHGYFTDGARTPGYPLFLALARWLWVPHQPDLVFGAALLATGMQSILGVVAIVLVYDTLRALRVSDKAAIAGTAFFAVLNGVCEFEMFVLSQSLSLFALVLAVSLFVKTMAKVSDGEDPTRQAIAAGAAFSFAVLVRPENLGVFAIAVLTPGLLWLGARWRMRDRERSRRLVRIALLIPLGAAPMLLAWMTWNYIGIGRFQITTLTAWNRNSAVYNLFDRVDPEDRVLGELLAQADLVRNHPEKVPPKDRFWLPKQPGQVVQDTVLTAFRKIIARHGEMPLPPPRTTSSGIGAWIRGLVSDEARRYTRSYAAGVRTQFTLERDPNDIGDYLASVSWKLARRYPNEWLRNAWLDFMREAFQFHVGPPEIGDLPDPHSYLDGGVILSPALRRPAIWSDRLQAPVMVFLFVLTLALAAAYPWAVLRRNNSETQLLDAAASALALGVLATIVGCCLLAVYMPHYGVPHWGTIVICGTYALDRMARSLAGYAPSR